jgi:hypothetical protein
VAVPVRRLKDHGSSCGSEQAGGLTMSPEGRGAKQDAERRWRWRLDPPLVVVTLIIIIRLKLNRLEINLT